MMEERNQKFQIEEVKFREHLLPSLFFEKVLYVIGAHVAKVTGKETFNLYRSLKRNGVDVIRGDKEVVRFLKEKGIIGPTHSVTLVPLEGVTNYLKSIEGSSSPEPETVEEGVVELPHISEIKLQEEVRGVKRKANQEVDLRQENPSNPVLKNQFRWMNLVDTSAQEYSATVGTDSFRFPPVRPNVGLHRLPPLTDVLHKLSIPMVMRDIRVDHGPRGKNLKDIFLERNQEEWNNLETSR